MLHIRTSYVYFKLNLLCANVMTGEAAIHVLIWCLYLFIQFQN